MMASSVCDLRVRISCARWKARCPSTRGISRPCDGQRECLPSKVSRRCGCRDSGASTASSLMSFLILARMAVDEVPEPSELSTWLEKKIAQLEHAARRVHVLAGSGRAKMVDSCMPMASAMSRRIIGRMCSSPWSRNSCWRSTMERATFSSVSCLISRLLSSQRASCSCVRMVAWLAARPIRAGVAFVEPHAWHGGGVHLHRPGRWNCAVRTHRAQHTARPRS